MSDIVSLSVGGMYYETRSATIDVSPVLKKLRVEQESPGTMLFVDRDGMYFLHVLNFLRNGVLVVPHDKTLLRALLLEARYFNLPSMETEVRGELAAWENLSGRRRRPPAYGP